MGTTTAARAAIILDSAGTSTSKATKLFCDRRCNVIAFIAAPGNRDESPLLLIALKYHIARGRTQLNKAIVSLDAMVGRTEKPFSIVAWSLIFLKIRGGRRAPKRGRQPLFETLYQERFSPLSGCSPGKISSVAYCYASNASVSCTMPKKPGLHDD